TRLQGDWSSDVCSSDLRAVVLRGLAEHALHVGHVVPVDGADVAHAERLEEGVGLEHLAERGPEALDALVEAVADERDFARHPLEIGRASCRERGYRSGG